nr:retrotransposon protein, putative, Ty1-copia subclass [Tanacetum cinerariifolium]
GSIMYAVRCTRPDVAFTQNITSRFQQNPGEPHWTAVKIILKFETDRDDTKSQTGYVFILNGGAVDWKSSKQSTTAMSATEAEYIATSEAGMEAVWIRKIISGLDPFTKALSKGKLTQHARSMGLRLASSFMFMNYLEEQTNGEAMINCIKHGDQPLPLVTQVSIAETSSTEQPPLKDKSMWSDQEKKIQKIDHLARSLLIQGLSNDIYSLIDSNKTFLNNLQPEWKQYATMMRQNKKSMDINIDALYNILKQNQGDVNDAMGLKKKIFVVTSNPLALIAKKTKVSKRKEKVVVSLNSERSDAVDFSELNMTTTLLAKAFNRRKFYSKPTNNNLRTSSVSQSANKKQEKLKKNDEKKQNMSKVKCYNCKKEGHFAKDCKKAKVKGYEYYKTKMLLAKKDKDEQFLLAEDHAWMESSSDLDQEINSNMVFMAQIEKVFLNQRLAHW